MSCLPTLFEHKFTVISCITQPNMPKPIFETEVICGQRKQEGLPGNHYRRREGKFKAELL